MIITKECNPIKLKILIKHGQMQRNAWEWVDEMLLGMGKVILNQIKDPINNTNNKVTIKVTMTINREDTICL